MNLLFILDVIFIISFLIFSIYYLKKLLHDDSNMEIIDRADVYEETIKWGLRFFIFSIIIRLSLIDKVIKNTTIITLLMTIFLFILITILMVLFSSSIISKKKKEHGNQIYKKLKKEIIKKYLIVMGICIFVIYPTLYLSIYFLSK